jgi:hypothetical protein
VRSVEVELAEVGRRIADLRAAEGWRLADLAEGGDRGRRARAGDRLS